MHFFTRMCLNHQSLRNEDSSLLTAEVSAIRQELAGYNGLSLAEVFGINLMTAIFHEDGTLPSITPYEV